eukprot:503154_1
MSTRVVYFVLLSLLFFSSTLIHVDAQSNTNPYKTLNVPKHATQKEIRKAFKTLALLYHPDRNLASSDPERMKKITAAYEILGDEKRRKKYDEEQRQNTIFAGHGFRRHSASTDGIGISLTSYNYYNLLHNMNDLPWLILAYEDFSQACKQAKGVFEDACIKLQGIARCAKVDVNKESSLINEFNLRRVPTFIIYYHLHGKTHKKSISWRGREKVKMHSLIDGVADIFPTKCSIIKTPYDMDQFVKDIAFNDGHYNKVKAVIFSDAKHRFSPHILLQYLATNFEDNIDFAYVHMDTTRPKKLQTVYSMAMQIGLDGEDLEPPSMYIIRSPLIHNLLLSVSSDEHKNELLNTLEDIGIYHVSLSSDVDSMKSFVEQYSLPLMPKLDGDNYLEQCFLDMSKQNIDNDKICYVFTVQNENEKHLQQLFLFGQYILAQLTESVQFGWINCEQQKAFCEAMKVVPSTEETAKIVAIKANKDYYQMFNNGMGIQLTQDTTAWIKDVVEWIGVLEKDAVVFGERCADQSEQCNARNRENKDDGWTHGVPFPIKTPKWMDNMDNILTGVTSVFGVVGNGVGAGFSAIGSLLSSLFQIFFVIIIFVFLLPMLRMTR